MGNLTDKDSELSNACKEGRLDDVERLVNEGVSLDTEYMDDYGRENSPLWYACWGDHVELVRFLLDRGADPNYGKESPLCLVCSCCYFNVLVIARMLLEYGADVNGTDNDDYTPLARAGITGELSIDLLELLIGKGADVNAVTEFRYNALQYAVDESQSEVAFLLLENGSEMPPYEQQKLMEMIVEKTQGERTFGLLRIAWERGVREIEDDEVRDKIVLPSWSFNTHWIYSQPFKQQVFAFLLAWNRIRIKYRMLPREIGLMVVRYMALDETNSVYDPIEQMTCVLA